MTHGKNSTYVNKGCRCDECRKAHADYARRTYRQPAYRHSVLTAGQRWRKRNVPRMKAFHRIYLRTRKYQLSPDEQQALIEAHAGLCAICGQPETTTRNGVVRDLCIDHDHQTGQVRGLLCNQCNNGLARFRDDPDLLERAIAYLKR